MAVGPWTSFQILLVLSFFSSHIVAQIVTPRGRVAAVYKEPNLESHISAEIEPNGRWRLEFTGAEIPARLPAEIAGVSVKFLLPARDTPLALLAHVRGPGKGNDGWIEPDKIEVSPDAAWKIPRDTPLFVPMKARQLPPVRSVPHATEAPSKACSYYLLVDPEGKVMAARPMEGAAQPAMEALLQQFRFTPLRVDGEPVHTLLAVRLDPTQPMR